VADPGARAKAGSARGAWVFLAGLLTALGTLVATGLQVRQDRLLVGSARADLAALVEAAGRFHQDYEFWPSRFHGDPGDYRYGTLDWPNRHVIDVLTARDGPGNPGHSVNPDRTVYLELRPATGPGVSGRDEQWNFVDPWGRPYQMAVNTDGDVHTRIADSVYGTVIGQGIVAWSLGPDGRSGSGDDLRSWAQSFDRETGL